MRLLIMNKPHFTTIDSPLRGTPKLCEKTMIPKQLRFCFVSFYSPSSSYCSLTTSDTWSSSSHIPTRSPIVSISKSLLIDGILFTFAASASKDSSILRPDTNASPIDSISHLSRYCHYLCVFNLT